MTGSFALLDTAPRFRSDPVLVLLRNRREHLKHHRRPRRRIAASVTGSASAHWSSCSTRIPATRRRVGSLDSGRSQPSVCVWQVPVLAARCRGLLRAAPPGAAEVGVEPSTVGLDATSGRAAPDQVADGRGAAKRQARAGLVRPVKATCWDPKNTRLCSQTGASHLRIGTRTSRADQSRRSVPNLRALSRYPEGAQPVVTNSAQPFIRSRRFANRSDRAYERSTALPSW